jgi:HK97 gp10 family phage protein
MMDVFIDTKWDGPEVKQRGNKVTGKSSFEIGLIVEGQAKLLSPKDTGRLAASITVQGRREGTQVEAASKYGLGTEESITAIKRPSSGSEVLVGTNVEYAPYMEFGTIFTNAQPFLRPALDLAKGKTLTIVIKNAKTYFKDYLITSGEYAARVEEFKKGKK